MKRLSKDMRQRLKRISRKIKRKSYKESVKQRRANRVLNSLPKHKKTPPERIIAPGVFSIESNETRRSVVEFLGDLRKTFVRTDVRAITIDFTWTTRFIASATLLFYAELSRLFEMTENRIRVRCKPPTNDRACQVLHQIGLFRLCGQNVIRRPNYYEDVVHWRVAHGHIVDNTICAPVIEEFEGQLALPLMNGIFRGLGEAMTNAKHHAYLDIREDGLKYQQPKKDWWMFSQSRQGHLSVVFCDLGIGIPKTLPIKKPNLFQKIISLGQASSDGACIKYAIEDSRSRTNLPGRGNGLGNIVNVISGLNDGIVMVMSNRGFYYSKNGDETETSDLKDSILGTLIYWRVPLAEKHHGK